MQRRPIDPLLFPEPTSPAGRQLVAPPEPTSAREPGRTPRWYARLRASTWLPILGKGAAITAVMLGFSALGAVSMATTEPGVHVAAQLAPLAPVEWLAPVPAPTPGVAPPLTSGAPPAGSAASGAPPSSSSVANAAADSVTPLGLRRACGEPGALCEKQKKPPEGLTSDGKVILNVANAEVLTQLPGVGTRRAEAIVELRQRLKRFRKPSDLLRVRGIGVRSLKRMLPHLVLDAPKPEAPAGAPEPPSGRPEPP
ncbi:MAG TPA: helix-hairpin-helix domain-containing protein [Polyangiaceae bacterium]|nr:helix-hairpin-helix domain-containing protein [Polyangiaceae bacterium]